MIVPTMTTNEIHQELLKDVKFINERQITRLSAKYDKIRRKNRIPKTDTFTYSFEFRTPSKNNCILFLSKAPADKNYKRDKSITIGLVLYYYSDIGIRAFRYNPLSNDFSVYNSHFFTRYNERLNLNLTSPMDKLKHFFTYNAYSYLDIKKKDDRINFYAIFRDGVGLGEMKFDVPWIIYKTFVSKDLLFDNQLEFEKELMDSLEGCILKELDKPRFNEPLYYHHADVFSGISKGVDN